MLHVMLTVRWLCVCDQATLLIEFDWAVSAVHAPTCPHICPPPPPPPPAAAAAPHQASMPSHAPTPVLPPPPPPPHPPTRRGVPAGWQAG
jgi:hypothetical protein